jgi:hypothetical protein
MISNKSPNSMMKENFTTPTSSNGSPKKKFHFKNFTFKTWSFLEFKTPIKKMPNTSRLKNLKQLDKF